MARLPTTGFVFGTDSLSIPSPSILTTPRFPGAGDATMTVTKASSSKITSTGNDLNGGIGGINTGSSGATSTTIVNSSSSSKMGLSTGAKIGIGIGVPVAFILIAALAFFLLNRRRQRRRQAGVVNPDMTRDMSDEAAGGLLRGGPATAVEKTAPPQHTHHDGAITGSNETEKGALIAEAPGQSKPVTGAPGAPAELGGRTTAMAELGNNEQLPSVDGVPSGILEMDGNAKTVTELEGGRPRA
ncbi:MAG: hypothetical protein M4579_001475 [Chaenotheca gracillima]|nr:MAG: hypothetical protein M4579_001475 [Chaenotheca gracillima]